MNPYGGKSGGYMTFLFSRNSELERISLFLVFGKGKEPNAFIFPTIFITVQFHTILRIPNTREQKPSQGCNHVTFLEVEAAISWLRKM